ncbi:diaminopimelate decarboxylase [Nocardioides sp. Soil797]|nr:diaminopimelate decarboxylase [Nocardioides sp. Soil797]
MPTAHPSGWAHADGALRGPQWLREPDDANALVEPLWSSTAHKNDDGALVVGGVDLRELAAEHGSPAYVLDEADFRGRAGAFRDAFSAYDVYYAGKAFLCTTVAQWIAEEGLCLDVCSNSELTVALRGGMDPARIGYHGNNKTTQELRRAVEAGVGRIVVDSLHEIDRLVEIVSPSAEEGVRQPSRDQAPVKVMIRVTAGVEAHTHEYIATAHEDQKFGFSITAGDAFEAVRRVLAAPGLELLGLHSHIGSQIFDSSGFEVAARRVLALHARVSDELSVAMPEMDLGGGFGIAYTTQDDPSDPAQLATEMSKIVEHECRALGIDEPRLSIEPGRAVVGPSMCTVYEVGTVKEVALDGPKATKPRRTYVSVDGGMSDNIRTALYDADYSCTLASRRSDAAPVLARVVGKHCEAGDIVVKDEFLPGDVAPGDLVAVPGTGAYCRSMASNYNHALRPPVIAVRDGVARVVVRRETEDDLLATDVAAQDARHTDGAGS